MRNAKAYGNKTIDAQEHETIEEHTECKGTHIIPKGFEKCKGIPRNIEEHGDDENNGIQKGTSRTLGREKKYKREPV